jgi:hypothetical protein
VSYGKGLHRSHAARSAHRLGAQLLGLSGTPRGSAQLTPCPRMDQGATSTCHAHSAAGAIWSALSAAGRPIGWVPSPLLIASCTYADVRAAVIPAGQPLPTLQDTGAELQDDATAMARWGIAPMGALIAGRDGISDVPDDPPDGIFPEPSRAQVEIAGADLVSGEYSIDVDTAAPVTCALALDKGIPVWVGTFVDTAFERLGPNDVAQPPNTDDANGGGHALYLSGYRTASDGTLEFRVENSWGTGWADGGAVWASQAWLLACWTLFPMAVAS